MEIILSDEIRQVWPQLCVAAIEASVINTPHNDSLWEEIFQEEKTLSERYSPDSLKSRPGIGRFKKDCTVIACVLNGTPIVNYGKSATLMFIPYCIAFSRT